MEFHAVQYWQRNTHTVFGVLKFNFNTDMKNRLAVLCVCVCVCVISCWILIDYFETPWIVAHQAPLSTEFSRQEYYSGLTFLLQGIFPIQGLNPHCISCIDKWILCHWATWEAQAVLKYSLLFCHFGRGLSTSVTCIIVLTSLYL